MPDFFEDDLQNPRGYTVKPGRPSSSHRALALTKDGACVFGKGMPVSNASCRNLGWMVYDDEVERQRRLLADTALAQLMIDNPSFAQPAVDNVSRGIQAYWQRLAPRLTAPASFKEIVDKNQKYVYGPTSFGRLTGDLPTATELSRFKAVIDGWVQLLQVTPAYLPQVISLHDMFLRIYKEQGPADGVAKANSPEYRDMEGHGRQFRRAWYDDPNLRGRDASGTVAAVSEWPGLLSADFTVPLGGPLDRCGIDLVEMNVEQRKRGVDMFVIKASTLEPAFRKVLADNNLPFSASASGTTSTLLTSAMTFGAGAMGRAESVQQYLMACVAYLVGGGMHTCHEVFVTGELAGLPYRPGKYIEMLPETFKGSTLYSKWSNEFWEIVRPDRNTVR
jgi:hypothetical protein